MGDFGWSYPPGVTGNEPQIAGPSIEEEKLGFIEDWTEEIKKMEDRLYEIAKEYDGEIGEGENPDIDDAFNSIFSGTWELFSAFRNERDQREEMMYGEVE